MQAHLPQEGMAAGEINDLDSEGDSNSGLFTGWMRPKLWWSKKNLCAQYKTESDVLWYDSRMYKAIPHEILSMKLNDPYTKAHPLRSWPTRMLCMLMAVTCIQTSKKV